jgi:hypothetical protein
MSYAKLQAQKLVKDRASYQAFRKLDQELYEARCLAAYDQERAAAGDQVIVEREEVDRLGPLSEAAKAAARKAEDRAQAAAEESRQAFDKHGLLMLSGSPSEVTDALVKAQAARETAVSFRKQADAAEAKRADLERKLIQGRKDHARAVQELAEINANPPVEDEARISDETIKANFAFMQTDEVWEKLSDRDKHRVHDAARPRGFWTKQERELFAPNKV